MLSGDCSFNVFIKAGGPNVPELEEISASYHRSYRPPGQLAGIILQLRGDNSSTLGVQLAAPVDSIAVLFDERKGGRQDEVL